jgi:hypothetical protein
MLDFIKKSTNTDLLPIIFFSDGGGASDLISLQSIGFGSKPNSEIGYWKILPLLNEAAHEKRTKTPTTFLSLRRTVTG